MHLNIPNAATLSNNCLVIMDFNILQLDAVMKVILSNTPILQKKKTGPEKLNAQLSGWHMEETNT